MLDIKYKELLQTILDRGIWLESRNSRTLQIPFYSFTINSKDWKLGVRPMHYKGTLGEFRTLMDLDNPLTNVSQFEANGCPYWDLWGGPGGSLKLAYYDNLHPQLEDIIEQIKVDLYSRRHVVDLWDHEQVQSGVLSLPSCWYNMTFIYTGEQLDLVWTQRSVDTYYGLPADIYLAYLFLQYVCEQANLPTGDIHFSLSNVHLYENQVQVAKEILAGLEPSYKPTLEA